MARDNYRGPCIFKRQIGCLETPRLFNHFLIKNLDTGRTMSFIVPDPAM